MQKTYPGSWLARSTNDESRSDGARGPSCAHSSIKGEVTLRFEVSGILALKFIKPSCGTIEADLLTCASDAYRSQSLSSVSAPNLSRT